MFNTQFDYQAELADEAAEEVQLDPPAYLRFLALRFDDPALGQVEFRRALALAIDREALARVAAPNAIVATGGIVPPPLQGHTPDIVPTFEPDRARELLRGTGVTHGLEIVTLGDFEHPVFKAVADCWSDVLGLPFATRPVGWEAFGELRQEAAIAESGWFPGYPDPEYYLRLLLHSDALDNSGGYASAHFDGLVERARAEHDGRARLELFHEADRYAVAEDVAVIPLLYERNMIMVKPWVRGWWEYGKTWSSYADLEIAPH